MENTITIVTSCDTTIKITNTENALIASFYNEGEDGELNLFGEITDVTLGGLMDQIKEYSNEDENSIDLY